MKIERICEKKGLIYIIGKNIKTFTEEKRLDLEYLSTLGNYIKSNDIYENSDFIDFFLL